MKKKVLTYAILILVLMVAFTNCGPMVGFSSNKRKIAGFASFGSLGCEQILKHTYATTYYPMLSNSCNRCHSSSHGSTDFNVSYQAFMIKTEATIDYKASQPHGDNRLDMTNQISGFKPAWNRGQDEYLACVSQTDSELLNSSKLKLNSKTIAGIAETQAMPTRWKFIEWDLEKDVHIKQAGLFAAFLKIEVRYAIQQGTIVGFEFRNPTVRLKTTGRNLEIKGLNVFIDNRLQSDVTTYLEVSKIFTEITDSMLITNGSNAFAFYPSANPNTNVAIEIANIQFVAEPTPPLASEPPAGTPVQIPVTFSQLVSNDPTLGVFRTSCLGCHSGASASAGLNLADYAVAKDRASAITARMNNAGNPMPPNGLLGTPQREVVSRWLNSGTPQ